MTTDSPATVLAKKGVPTAAFEPASPFEQVRDPDPAWATANPAAFLAWLWVVQRDCPALRDLLRS